MERKRTTKSEAGHNWESASLAYTRFPVNHWATERVFGPKGREKRSGDERIRTADPLRARQVLSQLSYTPILNWHPYLKPENQK